MSYEESLKIRQDFLELSRLIYSIGLEPELKLIGPKYIK